MDLVPYLNYLKNVVLLSEKTIIAYKSDLEEFSEYLSSKQIEDEREFTYQDSKEFLRYLKKERKYSVSSIKRKIASVKKYYNYLFKLKEVKNNPLLDLRIKDSSIRLPSFLSVDEVKALLSFNRYNFPDDRDHMLFLLLYNTGARISEALSINVKDIELDKRRIKVLGKRNKERYLFFSATTKEEIIIYLDKRLMHAKDENAFFISNKGKRLPISYVNIIFKKYANIMNFKTEFTPHTLRHSFATHMLSRGLDIRVLQELLGHKSIAATQIYTHVSKEELKRTYLLHHPHSKEKI